ncbi:MAG TPA: GNAT family N-acetyltransferase [Casimicrobiaceae bacterium]|nr:GNAT family N-acetyltransferase [Casimicrobiaceae bacterium]
MPPIMQFRAIALTDIPALFYVRTRTRENRYTLEELERLGITEESVSEKLSTSYKGWLCTENGAVVGFCIGDRATGELWVIAVLPEFEGNGIGAKLMSFAEEWLWSNGWTRAWLTTDIDVSLRAYGFYRKRGWLDWKVEDGVRWMEFFAPNVQTDSSPQSD